ncbi:retinaldehyde-binding protein 1-like [Halichondria panicea]|uniref:retinaldehyde-binding protein 1-like n=1 Tax=Halichondria panicea TaxID=6063 RepID=UPI00312B385C
MASQEMDNTDPSTISGATLEKAKRELNEDPGKRVELIQELGRQITEAEAATDDLKFTRKDNKFLLCFLRARKFDVERALQLYINYHKYRVKYAHLLTDYNAKSVEHILNSGFFGVLDQPLNDGSKCLVFLPGRYDIHNIPVSSLLKAALLVMDKLIEDEETQVHGLSLLQDQEGVSFSHVMTLVGTEVMRKAILVEMVQDAFPVRFKSCHMIRQPWYFSFVYTLIKPFLKQKLRDRIQLHGWDVEALHDHVDPSDLPEEFGGEQPPLPTGTLTKLFPGEL